MSKALERPQYIKDADKSTHPLVWVVSFNYWIPHEFGENDKLFEEFYFLDKRKAETFHRRLGMLANQRKINTLVLNRAENCSKRIAVQEVVPDLNPRWNNDLARY